MKYSWKIVLSCGKEYIVENEYKVVEEFLKWVFGTNGTYTLSSHALVGGGNIIISSSHVASIEYNKEFNKDLG